MLIYRAEMYILMKYPYLIDVDIKYFYIHNINSIEMKDYIKH